MRVRARSVAVSAPIEADVESADVAPTPADEEVFGNESKLLDQAARAWRGSQSAIRALNVRLRHARLPPVTLEP